MTINIDLN